MQESVNCPLWRYTTMKVGGEAGRLFHPASPEELIQVLERLRRDGEPWHILGGGSNMLVSSDGVAGAVIRMTQMTGIRPGPDGSLEADAGARLPHLAKHAASLGLSGLEFAVGIPGTVGGAVVMNAGAHGSCFANVVDQVTLFDTASWQVRTLSRDELEFQYRQSRIDPSREVVLSARLKLLPGAADEIKQLTVHNEEYRWRTQPLGWPNLGSTFKNPAPDKTAGFLLDESGAKEMREGNAAVSALHANFVINLGGANSSDIVTLLARMQARVKDRFGIRLHPEWRTLGRFSEAEQELWSGKS